MIRCKHPFYAERTSITSNIHSLSTHLLSEPTQLIKLQRHVTKRLLIWLLNTKTIKSTQCSYGSGELVTA